MARGSRRLEVKDNYNLSLNSLNKFDKEHRDYDPFFTVNLAEEKFRECLYKDPTNSFKSDLERALKEKIFQKLETKDYFDFEYLDKIVSIINSLSVLGIKLNYDRYDKNFLDSLFKDRDFLDSFKQELSECYNEGGLNFEEIKETLNFPNKYYF